MTTKWVYLFTEVADAEKHVGGSWDAVRGLLGGKGANLFEMTRIKLPVPPGFTVTTEACNAYLAAGEKFPEGMWDQELAALKAIEQITGKGFGDAREPAAGLLPLRLQGIDAGHDGHRPQHRPDRRDRRGAGRADRRIPASPGTRTAAWSKASARSCWRSPTPRSSTRCTA